MDTTSFKFPKLKGSTNYDIWAIRCKAFLIEKGHYRVLATHRDQQNTSKYLEATVKATALIRLTLEDSPLIQTQYIEDANELWLQLKELYEPKGFNSEFLICKELFSTTLSKCGNSIESYLTKIRRQTDQLAAKGLPIPPKVIAAYTLSNLTPEYESTVAIISQTLRTGDNQIDLLQLFGNLVDESRRLKYRENDTEMAMPLTNPRGKGKPKCNYCTKTGHLEKDCWTKNPKLKKGSTGQRTGQQRGSQRGSQSSQQTSQQNSQQMGSKSPNTEELALLSGVTACHAKLPTREIPECLSRSTGYEPKDSIKGNLEYPSRSTGLEAARVATILATRETHLWYLDSGATRHICANRGLFTSIEPCDITLNWGNAGSIQVKEIGTIRLQFESTGQMATISECLYLPEIGLNLLSLGQLLTKGVSLQSNQQGAILTIKERIIARGNH